jgi:dinuclear metal center YbgI/SA1388 family protein
MALCGSICDVLEEMFPLHKAMERDNVGLLIGYRSQPVQKVLLCLDVTSKTADEAIEKGCQMILSHHPLIFKPLSRISGETPVQDTVYKAIRNGLCIYAAHTNMDVSKDGTCDLMAELMGLKNVRPLCEESEAKPTVVGRIGVLEKEISLFDFLDIIKKSFKVSTLRYTGSNDKIIKKVALCSGSFDGNFAPLLAQRPDIYVSGEMKYHDVLDAFAYGLDTVLVGHYESEVIYKEALAKRLKAKVPDTEFIPSEKETPVLKSR